VKKLAFFLLTSWILKLNGYLCTPQSAFGAIIYFIKLRVFYANYSTVSSQRKNSGSKEKQVCRT
jgi:hypothetical protein